MMRTLLIATLLVCASPTLAQLDPGSYHEDDRSSAVYVIHTAAGEGGAVFVPGRGHPASGLDIWRWRTAPWAGAFKLSPAKRVSALPPAGKAVEQVFQGGKLEVLALPPSWLTYNWTVRDAQGRLVAYVYRDAKRLDWWGVQASAWLPSELHFEPVEGILATRAVRRGLMTRLQPTPTS